MLDDTSESDRFCIDNSSHAWKNTYKIPLSQWSEGLHALIESQACRGKKVSIHLGCCPKFTCSFSNHNFIRLPSLVEVPWSIFKPFLCRILVLVNSVLFVVRQLLVKSDIELLQSWPWCPDAPHSLPELAITGLNSESALPMLLDDVAEPAWAAFAWSRRCCLLPPSAAEYVQPLKTAFSLNTLFCKLDQH